ncbi:UDP-N-acetylmuramoyl-L-alanine--D-glutamate ligase [Limnohabitans sp. Rim8]|uniref:UDP-N-acetylmuramoyl-L-alanine--D-glutamate ligase n=1 Tax=Limnohabitans sp. Rim8 TaxID=1100718 RepID=UPI000D3C6743|nr:UDP-N-acetylmuramoyl-L-alanine--D-glutamate ligase [Limnohabitans sp. Rim8]PUE56666.1 UDP-N-acetylmuramoyl-L-alanine--D-glutamate ligase [Limnohabitans sp. Rim8]
MQQLHNQSVLILGLGDSGLAMARWCSRFGAQVQVVDTRAEPPHLAALRAELPQVTFVHGAFEASLVEGQDVRAVFKSPGLSPESVAPVWNAAVAAGLWVGTELTLFAQALSDLQTSMAYHPKVLAITGTNGKTTVTSLTGQLLARAGKRVAVAGNIGPTLLDTLSQALDKAAEEQAAADVIAAQEAAAVAADEAVAEQARAEAEAKEKAAAAQAAQMALEAEEALAQEAAADSDAASQMALTGTEAEQSTDATAEAPVDDEPFEVDLPPLVPPPPPPADHPYLPQVWVLELSSFQLEGVDNFEPTAATVLNLTQDHLDWHGSMDGYAAAKARIFGKQGVLVLNREDAGVMAMLPEPIRVKLQKPQVRAHITFGGDLPQRPGDYGIETVNGMTWLVRALEADETRKRRKDDEEEIHIQRLMPADALRIRGRHNSLNALAALALAGSAGGDLAPMLFGLREYQGEPHRVEAVTILNGVEYFDDSKGTNVGATVAALHGLGVDRRLVVILGGDGKGQDFAPLSEPVSRYARAVVLIGRDAPILREVLQHSGVTLLDAATLEDAVKLCSEQAHAGDAVLLSPACASMDMFRNYAHRAEVFVNAVHHLVEEAGGMV